MTKTGIRNWICIMVLIFIFLIPLLIKSTYWLSILVLVLINILLTSSLRIMTLLGNISLGHVGFSLIGAYGSALLSVRLGMPFWATLLIAGFMSGAVGLILGYPFLRIKGIYFSILTLLTAESLRLITFYWRSFTGGQMGLMKIPVPNPIPVPVVGIVRFDLIQNYYYLTFIIVILALFIIYKLEHSYLSCKWGAIKDADNLAQSVGINVIYYKIINFAIACFFAGIAGALFAHYQQMLSADFSSRFGVMASIYLLIYMVVGGENSFAGPIIGTIVVMLFTEFIRPLGQYQPMVIGFIVIFVVLFIPMGLSSVPDRLKILYNSMALKRKEKSVQKSYNSGKA